MYNKPIIITCGPIPAKVDSVKYITNRFKGGLALKTAEMLSHYFDVTVIKWDKSDLKTDLKTINVKDVYDYYNVLQQTEAEAYILAAAVANLTPTTPWTGKFPSHLYDQNSKFNIEFTIAPRSIDMIKKWHPRATLIGYKLFDGTDQELMDAARHTLTESRSNVVFANHPKWAKEKKFALMADGTSMEMSFDEHVSFIRRVIDLKWYKTQIENRETPKIGNWQIVPDIAVMTYLMRKIAVQKDDYSFGTAAIRTTNGFITTTRGKRDDGFCLVYDVDHDKRTVIADAKATMNAPTLHSIFNAFKDIEYILHGHRQLENVPTLQYAFSGTTEEVERIEAIEKSATISYHPKFNIKNHGYYACFNDYSALMEWVDANY